MAVRKIDQLSLVAIKRRLHVRDAVDLTVLETVDSTNTWLMQACKLNSVLPAACFAEKQTAGRGRRGKTWHSGEQSNIAMSLAWQFTDKVKSLSCLPLMFAMAVVKVLENSGIKNLSVKWPNDIYVAGEKIAGILLETCTLKNGRRVVIVGLGLNYDAGTVLTSQKEGLMLTDFLSHYSGNDSGRNELAGDLLNGCILTCQAYPAEIEATMAHYLAKYNFCKDKLLDIVTDDGKSVSGYMLGLTNDAELMVSVDGKEMVYYSAEVSVKVLKDDINA